MQPVDWALTRSDLTGPKQLLLVGLAWIADEEGVTFKGQETIAQRLGRDARWVRQHMRGLAEEGYISRLRRHRINGSRTTDLLVLNMPRERPVDLANYSGVVGELVDGDRAPTGGNPPEGLPAETCRPTGGNPPAPSNPLGNQQERGNAHASDSVPDDFPDDLRPHAREVMRVLRSVAEERGARRVTARAVALTLTPRRTKPLVKAAHDCAAWIADHPETPCRDVLARYRRWLDREPDLACVEPLADDGMPSAAKPNGVTRLRPRQSEREKREAGQQWSTFRNMGRMQGMTDAEAQAFASQQVGG